MSKSIDPFTWISSLENRDKINGPIIWKPIPLVVQFFGKVEKRYCNSIIGKPLSWTTMCTKVKAIRLFLCCSQLHHWSHCVALHEANAFSLGLFFVKRKRFVLHTVYAVFLAHLILFSQINICIVRYIGASTCSLLHTKLWTRCKREHLWIDFNRNTFWL